MTRAEFIQSFRQSQKRQNRFGFGVCGLLALTAIAGIPFAEAVDLDHPSPVLIVFGLFGAVMVVGACVLVRLSLKATLKCPRCGKQIVGLSGQVVIASGRCGYCGETILAE